MSGFHFLWRRGELDPRPNLAKKASLRRIVDVSFEAGCEERRRNHSCPIPYLNAPDGRPGTEFTDNSAHLLRCERREKMNVARGDGELTLEPSRRRTQCRRPYRSKETSLRLQECSWQVWLLGRITVSYERALRRTSFKVQTVKAGHPREMQNRKTSELFGTTDFSILATCRASRRVSSGLRGGRPCLCRGQSRCAPSRTCRQYTPQMG